MTSLKLLKIRWSVYPGLIFFVADIRFFVFRSFSDWNLRPDCSALSSKKCIWIGKTDRVMPKANETSAGMKTRYRGRFFWREIGSIIHNELPFFVKEHIYLLEWTEGGNKTYQVEIYLLVINHCTQILVEKNQRAIMLFPLPGMRALWCKGGTLVCQLCQKKIFKLPDRLHLQHPPTKWMACCADLVHSDG